MKTVITRASWTQLPSLGAAALVVASLGASAAYPYSVPYSTPSGITLVDVSKIMDEAIPQFLWRRLGDANGNPLYTYDADQNGRSSCYDECAKEFPPFVADAHARGAGDFSIIVRDGHVRQWTYERKPLYRYSGKDPEGEPVGARFELTENPAWHDPSSAIYSPKHGWRRAEFMPAKSTPMPPNVELDAVAVADGFGFVDASTHLTIYAVPLGHKLSGDWHPLRASALELPVGEFSIVKRKDDGTRQWVYRGDGLYTYTGDYAPGEVRGIFTGDKKIEAALVYQNFIPPGLAIGDYAGRGPLLTNSRGLSLYTEARYHVQYGGRETRTGYAVSYNDAKSQGTVGCGGDCTETWKPMLAPANAQAWGFWELTARPDGSKQWMFKGSPVYSYVGDEKPGDINGNNRHVIVYGGPQGQIVYANPGVDPRGPKSRLGKLDMIAAAGPNERSEEAPDVAADAGARAGKAVGSANNTSTKAGGADAAAPRRYARGDRRQGAGFYWHTAGLFY